MDKNNLKGNTDTKDNNVRDKDTLILKDEDLNRVSGGLDEDDYYFQVAPDD